MKTMIAIALVAASIPFFATAASASENNARERRYCTNVEMRAGSRMSQRRVCKTQAEWRQALGPDWRQHLAGARNIELDADALAIRSAAQEGRASAPN